MRIIEIAPLDNGAHRNQNGGLSVVPEGWAVVPVDANTLSNFPFGNFEVEDVDGVPHMVPESWEPLPMSESAPEPTQMDRIEAQVTYTAMMTDTLLEV